ncbi:MAG: hypothetical protein WC426_14220 [Sulfuriferula sp.]
MKTFTLRGQRGVYALIAAGLLLSAALPIFMGRASAATFATRSLKMSDSTPGATSVQYDLTVTPQASGDVLGVVIDFCDSGPIIGDATCTATPGTDTPNLSSAALAGWTKDTFTSGGANNRVVFTIGSNSWTSGTPVTLSITGITNPTNVGTGVNNGTFYARVLSYDTVAKAKGYTTADPAVVGAPIDTGGFALSTANKLSVTAKVQEKLTFCVYTLADCTAGGSSITLGNNGVLDETQAYNNYDTKFDVGTNAQSGVIVRAKTFASPGHTLTTGGNSIAAIGATAAASNQGAEQFGMCVVGSGSLVADSPYTGVEGGADVCATDSTTGSYNQATTFTRFAWDTAATGTTFGDDIAHSAVATTSVTGHLNFIGNIAITTEAGVYTTDISLIATSTF